MGLDTTLPQWTMPEVMKRFYPKGTFGEDRDGHPVWYYNLGNLDPRGEITSVS